MSWLGPFSSNLLSNKLTGCPHRFRRDDGTKFPGVNDMFCHRTCVAEIVPSPTRALFAKFMFRDRQLRRNLCGQGVSKKGSRVFCTKNSTISFWRSEKIHTPSTGSSEKHIHLIWQKWRHRDCWMTNDCFCHSVLFYIWCELSCVYSGKLPPFNTLWISLCLV